MNLLKKQWGLLSSVFFLSRIFLSSCNGQCSLICLSLEIAVSLMGKNWAAYPFSQKVLVISCGRKEEEENPFCTLPQFPMVFFFSFFFVAQREMHPVLLSQFITSSLIFNPAHPQGPILTCTVFIVNLIHFYNPSKWLKKVDVYIFLEVSSHLFLNYNTKWNFNQLS